MEKIKWKRGEKREEGFERGRLGGVRWRASKRERKADERFIKRKVKMM